MEPTVAELLDRFGRTYAEEAGITLRDKPSPLYRLLVLTVLCSVRIGAGTATAAARELSAAGLRTPRAMADARRRTLIAALGRAHYVRYDESTATALAQGAGLLLDRWHGDLRRLREEAGGESERIGELLREFPGSGRSAPGSSGARRRRSGPRCGRTSTSGRWRRPGRSGCRASRTGWRRWSGRGTWPGWRRR